MKYKGGYMSNKFPGVYKNRNSISMVFNYMGKQIKKTFKIPPTYNNEVYVYHEKIKILESIEKGEFDLDDFYSHSKRTSDASRAKRYTFDEMYSEFVLSYGSEKAPATMRGYNKIAKDISFSIGNRPMNSISSSELRKILKKNYGHRSNKTISEMINVWRRAHIILSQKLKNPRYKTEEFKGLKKTVTPPSPYKKDQIFLIYDNLKYFDHNALALPLSIFTGLRPGEVSALAVEDIDMDATPPTLTVKRSLIDGGTYKLPKSDSSYRTIELSKFAIDVVNNLLVNVKNKQKTIPVLQKDYKSTSLESVTFIFTSSIGKEFRSTSHLTKTVSKHFERDLSFLSIEYRPIRIGRQSFATFCLELGATFMSVAKELGHKDQRILEDHYSSSKHAEPTHKILNNGFNRRK